jgi:hypothetical protein
MKLKLLSLLAVATVVTSATSNAAVVTLSVLANSSLGFITTTTPALIGDGLPSGRAIVVSVTNSLNAVNVTSSMNALLAASNSTPSQFDTALNSLIAATNPTLAPTSNPGIVRSTTFTSGAIASGGAQEVGTAANKSYLFFVAEAGGFITAIGAYTGPNTPGSGALTLNPGFAGDTLGVGTSVFAAGSAGVRNSSGFQLVQAVPEPSSILLGAIGALGLLRRRRI